MDKRWRNLGILLVIIILIVAGWYYFNQQSNPATLEKEKIVSVAKLLVANDLNYSDLKIATELFSYSLPPAIASKIKNDKTAPIELKDALNFDIEQTNLVDKYVEIINGSDTNFYCARTDELDKIKTDSLELLLRMDEYYSKNNILGIDSNAVLLSYDDFIGEIDSADDYCFNYAYELIGAGQ